MSSVSRTGNRTSAIAGAIRSLQSGNTEVQDQLKNFLVDHGNQQKALLKRLEELESSNKTLVNDVQSLRVELQAVRSASVPAPTSASPPKS
jgi:predicted nuclease with TOPRIM domain